ncbi:uncharacterized protein STEHIDRAFT_161531 [Stereum hirsutum FP-91666 SS1]|uniref:uncharacterized protein n=1 Tax=Stereum hirsutum (strain FP-91666) TaxID=721885 RepID=UPI0004449E6A|nr:uncharacterized protein STEHIDRAFT_161531 [Stereum hirsutum FP-91666 SS1]EIM81337.1 hypothetical protein STEHIDRAFT_161531 [Stereum hirsutum FP-91666 SS1]
MASTSASSNSASSSSRPTLRRPISLPSLPPDPSASSITTSILSAPSFDTVSTTPSLPLFLTILFGLPIALWTYKCLMLFLFQRKIIYMGYAPIGARGERLGGRSMGVNGGEDGSTIRKVRDGDAGMGDVVQAPRGVEVEEVSIPSGKGGMLSGIVVRKEGETYGSSRDAGDGDSNAGSPLHRLPLCHSLIASFPSNSHAHAPIILAVAPRSYWMSTAPPFSFPFSSFLPDVIQRALPRPGPTQKGLIEDYTAVLRYATERWTNSDGEEGARNNIVIWGHSLGASVACCTLASIAAPHSTSRPPRSPPPPQPHPTQKFACTPALPSLPSRPIPIKLHALILENPFLSIPHMLCKRSGCLS